MLRPAISRIGGEATLGAAAGKSSSETWVWSQWEIMLCFRNCLSTHRCKRGITCNMVSVYLKYSTHRISRFPPKAGSCWRIWNSASILRQTVGVADSLQWGFGGALKATADPAATFARIPCQKANGRTNAMRPMQSLRRVWRLLGVFRWLWVFFPHGG